MWEERVYHLPNGSSCLASLNGMSDRMAVYDLLRVGVSDGPGCSMVLGVLSREIGLFDF